MTILQAILNRRSVRSFSDSAIPADVLGRLKTALRAAPSACNNQPWRFILVTDAELRRQLGPACRNQVWIAEAPLIVVACGLPEKAYKKMGGCGNSTDIDLAIALDHLSLAAAADGLGTCWIGAFTEQAVKDLLAVPPDVKVVALMPVGYPKPPDLIRPLDELRRKAEGELFCENGWQ